MFIRERLRTAGGMNLDCKKLWLHGSDGEYEMSNSRCVSRRTFIGGAALLAGAAATPGLIVTQTALAQQKVPPASVKCKDKPKGNQQCSKCRQFLRGHTLHAMG